LSHLLGRRGILPRAHRSTGYREYTDDDLCQLRIVVSNYRSGVELSVVWRLD
jgi:DNA-binding transcriptional MerR regulator